MAIQTDRLGQLGPALFDYDYDDVTNLIQLVRCVNDGDQPALWRATRTSDGLQYSQSCPALQTTVQNVPQQVATQLLTARLGPGKYTGVSFEMFYPAL